MEPTEVIVQLIPGDIREFHRHCDSQSSSLSLQSRKPVGFQLACWIIAIAVIVGLRLKTQDGQPVFTQEMARIVVGVAVFLILLFFFFRWFAFRPGTLKRSQLDIFLPKLYRLGADGIYEENAMSQNTQKWTGIQCIDETKDFLFFLLAPRRGYVIPKRCFHPSDAASVFADQARAFLFANRAQTSLEASNEKP